MILIPLVWDQTGELLSQLVLSQTGEPDRSGQAHVQTSSLFQKMPIAV